MMPTTSSRSRPVESTLTASAAWPLCAASIRSRRSTSARVDQLASADRRLARAEVDRRDRMDAAQSGKAADAVEVDSTGLDLDEVTGIIVGLALQKSK